MHLRTSNPIESIFAGERLCTTPANACGLEKSSNACDGVSGLDREIALLFWPEVAAMFRGALKPLHEDKFA